MSILNVSSPLDEIMFNDPIKGKEKAKELCKEIRKEFSKEKLLAKPNTFVSLGYLVHDIVLCLVYGLIMRIILGYEFSGLVYFGLFCIHSIVFGTLLTGLWVLGHECGHGAFSSTIIGDIVGFVLHSFLLVPYYSWKETHAKHHRNTNSLHDGETHVPSLYDGVSDKIEKWIGEDAFSIFQLITHLLLGWPLYLLRNATGGHNTTSSPSHFVPSDLFREKVHPLIYLSTFGCMVTLCGIRLCSSYGVDTMFWYWGPYCVVNCWLVGYTWLQHTDPSVPHYGKDVFSFEIGALSTIDRPYWYMVDYIHHHIGSTHVAHHINYQIPHYRSKKATEIVRRVLGPYYRFDPSTNIFNSLWKIASNSHYVDGLEGVQKLRKYGKKTKIF